MERPTVFITISRGGTARNILKTDTYKVLREAGFRLMILTPAWQDRRFIEEFGGPDIEMIALVETDWTRLDLFFVGLAKALVYNSSTEMRDRYGIYSPEEASTFRYWLKRIVFRPFRTIGWLKELVRWFDARLVPDRYYAKAFDKYKPSAVFSTSVIEDVDVYVLKQARQRKIPVIAMPKSWDNLSKMSARVKPDRMIVWSEYSKEESVTYQNMRPEDIVMCGIPQFDAYVDPAFRMSREEYIRGLGLDPQKKLIVYASEGKVSKHDPDLVDMLVRGIQDGHYGTDAQLFIRPHFIYRGDTNKFTRFKGMPGVAIDDSYQPSACFRDQWDYSDRQITHMVNLLAHCDLLITSNSTMVLDASAFDKPTINVSFDGYAKRPFAKSIAKWNLTVYYRKVIESGAPWTVRSEEEFHEAVKSSLLHPEARREQRKRLCDYFCGPYDGRSGQRIGEEIVRFVKQHASEYVSNK